MDRQRFFIWFVIMSQHKKLVNRFLSKPKDFTYDELKRLLNGFGYYERTKGKTSGSRVSFINPVTSYKIELHKPHPKPVLKVYKINEIIKELKKQGIIE